MGTLFEEKKIEPLNNRHFVDNKISLSSIS